jgi:hypothetical protein
MSRLSTHIFQLIYNYFVAFVLFVVKPPNYYDL